MTIPKDSRVYRTFYFGLRLIEALKGEALTFDYINRGTNLCHLVRVIIVWIPLVFVAQFLFVAAPIAALIGVPLFLFGIRGEIHMLESLGSLAVGIRLLVWWVKLVNAYRSRHQPRIEWSSK